MGCGRSRLENDYPDPNAHWGKPNPVATFETTMGIIKAEIFMDRVPRTASNFIDLCRTGFYNGVHFRELSWPLHEPHTPTVGSVGGNVARQFCSLHPPVPPRQLCTRVGTLAQPCRPAALLTATAAPEMTWLPLNVAVVDNDRGASPNSYRARALGAGAQQVPPVTSWIHARWQPLPGTCY